MHQCQQFYFINEEPLFLFIIIRRFLITIFQNMKEQLKKLKNTSVTTAIGQLYFKDICRTDYSQFDQIYYSVQQQFLLCKIYHLDSQISCQRFEKQKQIYLTSSFNYLAHCISCEQFKTKKNQFGLIILDKFKKYSSLLEVGTSLSFCQLLNLSKTVLSFIGQLKRQNSVFLNIKPQNISQDTQGNFVIVNPEYLSHKGTRQQIQQLNSVLMINIEKQYKYFSPQLLDNYSQYCIDYKSDIFSLGCILYQIIFGFYPFQSKLANINLIYQQQQGFFGQFISKIFKPYKQRADVQFLINLINQQLKKNPQEPQKLNSASTAQSKTAKNTSSFFDDITSVFNKYTKQSQGAYLNYTQNNDEPPCEKYSFIIITKMYKNDSKIQKMQQICKKHIKQTQMNTKSSFLFKNLLLIFEILRKGPSSLIQNWSVIIKEVKETSGSSEKINQICNILNSKITLNCQLASILKGNFYLQDISKIKQIKLETVKKMMLYLTTLIMSTNKMMSQRDTAIGNYTIQILCDQIYDLVSMIIMIIICIRKDNQLQLRVDNLKQIDPIQKNMNTMLKKISNIANYIEGHSIYSLQSDYLYYKQQLNLVQNPYCTSYQYFLKHNRNYKGLSIPINFSTSYNPQSKQFDSYQAAKQGEKKNKEYLNYQINSDDQGPKNQVINKYNYQNPTYKNITNQQKKQKSVNLDKINDNNNKLTRINSSSQTNKQKPTITIPTQKPKVSFQDFGKFMNNQDNSVSQGPNLNQKVNLSPKKINNPNANDMFKNFLFQIPKQKKNLPPKQKGKQQLNFNNFSMHVESIPKNKVPKAVQNLLGQDINNFQWLKKAQKKADPFLDFLQKPKNIQQSYSKQPSAFVKQIINSIKLKELKQLIIKNQDIAIQFNNLQIQKVIGSGSAGQVYLGKYKSQAIAIKKVKTKQNPNALKQFQRQLVTYIKIKKNPYLVSLVGLSKSGQDFYLLTQFCSGGSLFDLLHKKANIILLTWVQKLSLALQIAKGMLSLHNMNPAIIHRDLKSLNVFIMQQNNQWIAKVADFGLSRSPQSQMMTMALGTLHWMAPQLLDNKQYSLKVDVYSYGVVLWQICARKTPYYQLSNPMAIMKHVAIQRKRPNLNIIDPGCPPKIIEIIQKCWAHQPNDRPYFKEIIQTLQKIKI